MTKDRALRGHLIDINYDLMCVHTSNGTYFCQSQDEIRDFTTQEIARIKRRPHPLSRWEHWELPPGQNEHRLLLSRVRNDEERALVRRYIEKVGVKVDRDQTAQ